MQEAVEPRREIKALTGLRSVAAFLVFAFHVDIRWPLTGAAWAKNVLSQGAIGMTIFFMLSGFILAYTYSDREFAFREFYKNRFARIYPVYVVAGLFALPWLAVIFSDGLMGIARGVAVVFTSTFMIQAWFPQLFSYWNNPAAWSLSAEAFFYLTFPFFLIGIKRLSRGWLWVALLCCYVLAILPGAVYAAFEPRPSHGLQLFYALPIMRLPEFLFGAVLFMVSNGVAAQLRSSSATVTSVGLLLAYLVIVGDKLPIFVLHNWIVVPVFGLLLLGLLNSENIASRVLSTRPFVYSGEISYCFYSFQFTVLFSMIALRSHLPTNPLAIFFLAFVPLTLLSVLGYHAVEKPCRNWIRQSRPHSGTNPLLV